MLFMNSVPSMVFGLPRVHSHHSSIFSSESLDGISVQGSVFMEIPVNRDGNSGIVIENSVVRDILSCDNGSLMIVGNDIFIIMSF